MVNKTSLGSLPSIWPLLVSLVEASSTLRRCERLLRLPTLGACKGLFHMVATTKAQVDLAKSLMHVTHIIRRGLSFDRTDDTNEARPLHVR